MKKILYPLIIISFFFSACTEWLTIQPEDKLSKDEMFNSQEGFYNALYGVYTLCDNNYGHNGDLTSSMIELLASQWEARTETEKQLQNHEYSFLDGTIGLPFLNQYQAIANVNLMLEYLEKQDVLTNKEYKELKGECLALRAWLHFDLIRTWGPVPKNIDTGREFLPYVTTLSKNRNTYLVYNDYMARLDKDMEEAETLLANMEVEKNYRLNSLGVKALQARIKLWQGKTEEALAYAKAVIEFSKANEIDYALAKAKDIASRDYAFKIEHLFGRYDDFESTPFNTNLYKLTSDLDKLYESSSSDIRTEQWEDRNVTGQEAPSMNLLKFASGKGSVPIIRLAEIYFIAMECGTLSEANELYKDFCVARSVPFTPIESTKSLNDILFKEYRKEFIGEGVMFFYYKRNQTVIIPGRPEPVLGNSYILPLPKKEINVDL